MVEKLSKVIGNDGALRLALYLLGAAFSLCGVLLALGCWLLSRQVDAWEATDRKLTASLERYHEETNRRLRDGEVERARIIERLQSVDRDQSRLVEELKVLVRQGK